MKWKLTLLFFLTIGLLRAQKFTKVYEHQIDAPFFKIFEDGAMDFHISSSGKHMVIGTDEWIKVRDDSGKLLFNQECVLKSNKKGNHLDLHFLNLHRHLKR